VTDVTEGLWKTHFSISSAMKLPFKKYDNWGLGKAQRSPLRARGMGLAVPWNSAAARGLAECWSGLNERYGDVTPID